MGNIVDFKSTVDGFDVEYEILPAIDVQNVTDERERRVIEGSAQIEEQLEIVQTKIAALNSDIDRLTNHSDGIDYAIAVTSGIITGIIDATIVGEWNFAEAKKDTYKGINKKVIEFAKKQPNYVPYCNTTLENLKKNPPKAVNPRLKPKDPDRLETAIEFLEYQFHLPGDGAYKTGKYGIGGDSHRIEDFCHHPTLVGLVCCIIVQFSKSTIYVNQYGEDVPIPITVNEYGNFVGNNPVTKMFAGVINWFITCAKTIANRKGHLMSDIATSASLPGSFVSFMYELAAIPCFRDVDAIGKLRNAYMNGIGTGNNQVDLGAFNKLFEGANNKLDVTTEKAVLHELKRQAMPVVINEILVRASYFIRRFIIELKEKNDIAAIDWKKVIPFNNRTIVRMMTIATGTFTAIDMADAAVHAATKSVDVSTFFSNMLLRVNFVGVGRFAVAITTDVGMGVSKAVKTNQRIKYQDEQIKLLNAKVYYKQAGVWIAAETTGKTIEDAYSHMRDATETFVNAFEETKASLKNIGEMAPAIEEKNPGLIADITDILNWG